MITTYEDWTVDKISCYDLLIKQFKTKSLKGFGIEKDSLAIMAAGCALFYVDKNFLLQHK